MTDPLITDELVDAAKDGMRAVHGGRLVCDDAEIRAALEAVVPYLRPAIAEEIAQAIEAAVVGGSWVDFGLGYREAQSRHAALARSVGAAHPDATTHPNTKETP